MSPKELLYVEDALGHEKQMQDICCNYASQLKDTELKNFVQGLSDRCGDDFNKIYSLLLNA